MMRPIRGALRVSLVDELALAFDPEHADHITLTLSSPRSNERYADCELAVEVGPASIRTRQTAVAEDLRTSTHELHRVDDFLALGLVDRAWVHFCGRRTEITRYLGAIRRFVLATMLARAEADQGSLGLDLPPAPESADSPTGLPERPSQETQPGPPDTTEGVL